MPPIIIANSALVTVEGRYDNQQIVNYFYYRFANPVAGGTGGNSATFIVNFRASFRANMLSWMYSAYHVRRYWVREIMDVAVADPGPPTRFRNIYNPDGLDYVDGDVALDDGDVALPGGSFYLPAHEALRVFKRPTNSKVGYFKSSYNRFSPQVDTNLDPVNRERFLPAYLTSIQDDLAAFAIDAILDQAGGNGWQLAVWSAPFFSRVVKPAGGPLWQGSQLVFTYIAAPYVGTQVSRRFSPGGIARGA